MATENNHNNKSTACKYQNEHKLETKIMLNPDYYQQNNNSILNVFMLSVFLTNKTNFIFYLINYIQVICIYFQITCFMQTSRDTNMLSKLLVVSFKILDELTRSIKQTPVKLLLLIQWKKVFLFLQVNKCCIFQVSVNIVSNIARKNWFQH